MGYNKFITKDGIILLDLTETTVSEETLAVGVVAINKNGEKIVGIMSPPVLQEKNVIPLKEVQYILPDSQYNGLSQVTVESIPEAYIIPEGVMSITQNGLYDIAVYSQVDIDIPEEILEEWDGSGAIIYVTDDDLESN